MGAGSVFRLAKREACPRREEHEHRNEESRRDWGNGILGSENPEAKVVSQIRSHKLNVCHANNIFSMRIYQWAP